MRKPHSPSFSLEDKRAKRNVNTAEGERTGCGGFSKCPILAGVVEAMEGTALKRRPEVGGEMTRGSPGSGDHRGVGKQAGASVFANAWRGRR